MSDFGGTTTAGPNFSYALAARAMRRRATTLDLSGRRIEVVAPGRLPDVVGQVQRAQCRRRYFDSELRPV